MAGWGGFGRAQRGPTPPGDPSPASLLDSILSASDAAIVVEDRTGIVTGWNPAAEALYGYPAAEIVGKSIAVLNAAEALPSARARENEPVARCEALRVRKGGDRIRVALAIAPVRNTEGTVVGVVEAAPDAIVVVDRSGRIALVNAQTERLFGHARAALVGEPVERLIPSGSDTPTPSTAPGTSPTRRSGAWARTSTSTGSARTAPSFPWRSA